jgi:plastocyanin
MAKLLVVMLTIFALVSAAGQTTAQEEEQCPEGTADAALMASPTGSPTGSPTTEPYGSPTTEPNGSPTASPTTVETCLVIIDDFEFMPKIIQIPVGTSVIWRNDDSTWHTASAVDDSWDSGRLDPGDVSTPVTFDTVGNVPYQCNRHPTDMKGTVQVVAG